MAHYSVGLELAGIGIEIRVQQPEIAKSLHARYLDFPLSRQADTIFDCASDDYQSPARVEYRLREITAHLVFDRGGVLIHGAGIVDRGHAHVFCGPSGSGKTTLARSSPGKTVLNDDLVILLVEQGRWAVHSTPFSNLDQIRPTPGHAPLSGLYSLAKDHRVYLRPLNETEALARLIGCVPVITRDRLKAQQALDRLAELVHSTVILELHFPKGGDIWEVIPDAAA